MRVVALRALGLGDLLTAVPALRALQDHVRSATNAWKGSDPSHALVRSGTNAWKGSDPVHASVVVVAPRALAPLVELLGCSHLPAAPLGELPAGSRGADLLVNLHGRGPQSHRVALAAAPRRLVAFAHPEIPESAGAPAWEPDEHEVHRWCRLLRESGVPADPSRLALPDPGAAVPGPDPAGATVVHPGAASGARRWPAARFARVAAEEARAGRRVLLTGSPGERELALDVARRAGLPEEAVLAGRTDLLQLASVVARAARVVCGDTGVAHLATALGTPSVLLFGPTSPERWGPIVEPARHRVLWTGATGDPHAQQPDPGLLAIAPADVLGELALLP